MRCIDQILVGCDGLDSEMTGSKHASLFFDRALACYGRNSFLLASPFIYFS